MKTMLITALLVSAAAVSVDSSAASKPEDAIKQAFAEADRCLANNDAKCLGDLMVEDATFITPASGTKIIKGKAKIVETLQESMGGPEVRDAKQKNSVDNVRLIGEDHAVVDSSTEVTGMKAGAETPLGSYHAVAIMVRKGDKWLVEDLRSYVVERESSAKNPTPPATKSEPPAEKPAPPSEK